MRTLSISMVLVAALACGQTQSQSWDKEVTITHNTYAILPDSQNPRLGIGFALDKDSRCPKNSQCVSAGEVALYLHIIERSGIEIGRTVVMGNGPNVVLPAIQVGKHYTLTLLRVDPYPDASANPAYPPKNKYTLTVRVSHVP